MDYAIRTIYDQRIYKPTIYLRIKKRVYKHMNTKKMNVCWINF